MTENIIQNDILLQASDKINNLKNLSSSLFIALENNDNSNIPLIKKHIMACIVDLRLINWKSQQLINSTKDTTAKTKQEADAILLDIQNIYDQHKHLNREIEKCENFVSMHDQLDLIPLEKFLGENENLRQLYERSLQESEEVARRNLQHTITVERLKDEENRRLELFVSKTKLQETRARLNSEIKSLRDDLEDLNVYEPMFRRFTSETEQLRKVFHKH